MSSSYKTGRAAYSELRSKKSPIVTETAGTFDRNKGIFALCSGYWDEKKGKYVKSDTTEIFRCCIDRCNFPVAFCNKYCEDAYGPGGPRHNPYWEFRCKETCNDQQVVCEDGCKTGKNWGDNNPFIVCAKEKDCWFGVDSKPECIKKHKEELIECCRKKCYPDLDTDCDDLCDYTYELTSVQRAWGQDPETMHALAPPNVTYEDKIWKYVLLGVGLSLVGILIFLSVMKYKK